MSKNQIDISDVWQKRTRRRSDKYTALLKAVPEFLGALSNGAKHKDLCEHFNLSRNDATFIKVLKQLVEEGHINRETNKDVDARVVLYTRAKKNVTTSVPPVAPVAIKPSIRRLDSLEVQLAERDIRIQCLEQKVQELEASLNVIKQAAMAFKADSTPANPKPLPTTLQDKLREHIHNHQPCAEKVVLGGRIKTTFLERS